MSPAKAKEICDLMYRFLTTDESAVGLTHTRTTTIPCDAGTMTVREHAFLIHNMPSTDEAIEMVRHLQNEHGGPKP